MWSSLTNKMFEDWTHNALSNSTNYNFVNEISQNENHFQTFVWRVNSHDVIYDRQRNTCALNKNL